MKPISRVSQFQMFLFVIRIFKILDCIFLELYKLVLRLNKVEFSKTMRLGCVISLVKKICLASGLPIGHRVIGGVTLYKAYNNTTAKVEDIAIFLHYPPFIAFYYFSKFLDICTICSYYFVFFIPLVS